MSRKTKNSPSTETETTKAATEPKGEAGRVLKRKTRTTTPKPRDKEKPTTAGQEAPIEAASPTPKPARERKATAKAKAEKSPKAEKPSKAIIAGSLANLRQRFCAKLLEVGKSQGTARSYAADLTVACKHFGEDKLVAKLSRKEIEGYFASDRIILARTGERRNQITIDKVIRVFRQAIDFAAADGWMKVNPLPAQERRARKTKTPAQAAAAKVEADGSGETLSAEAGA